MRGRKSGGRRGRKRRAAEQQRKEGRTYLPVERSQSRVAVRDGVTVDGAGLKARAGARSRRPVERASYESEPGRGRGAPSSGLSFIVVSVTLVFWR
jgi:hypothetical protein